jgi:hypothetical protein
LLPPPHFHFTSVQDEARQHTSQKPVTVLSLMNSPMNGFSLSGMASTSYTTARY